jgi:hypothetical protein
MARLSAGHARSRTQIIPICVIGADSDEIGEAMQAAQRAFSLTFSIT